MDEGRAVQVRCEPTGEPEDAPVPTGVLFDARLCSAWGGARFRIAPVVEGERRTIDLSSILPNSLALESDDERSTDIELVVRIDVRPAPPPESTVTMPPNWSETLVVERLPAEIPCLPDGTVVLEIRRREMPHHRAEVRLGPELRRVVVTLPKTPAAKVPLTLRARTSDGRPAPLVAFSIAEFAHFEKTDEWSWAPVGGTPFYEGVTDKDGVARVYGLPAGLGLVAQVSRRSIWRFANVGPFYVAAGRETEVGLIVERAGALDLTFDSEWPEAEPVTLELLRVGESPEVEWEERLDSPRRTVLSALDPNIPYRIVASGASAPSLVEIPPLRGGETRTITVPVCVDARAVRVRVRADAGIVARCRGEIEVEQLSVSFETRTQPATWDGETVILLARDAPAVFRLRIDGIASGVAAHVGPATSLVDRDARGLRVCTVGFTGLPPPSIRLGDDDSRSYYVDARPSQGGVGRFTWMMDGASRRRGMVVPAGEYDIALAGSDVFARWTGIQIDDARSSISLAVPVQRRVTCLVRPEVVPSSPAIIEIAGHTAEGTPLPVARQALHRVSRLTLLAGARYSFRLRAASLRDHVLEDIGLQQPRIVIDVPDGPEERELLVPCRVSVVAWGGRRERAGRRGGRIRRWRCGSHARRSTRSRSAGGDAHAPRPRRSRGRPGAVRAAAPLRGDSGRQRVDRRGVRNACGVRSPEPLQGDAPGRRCRTKTPRSNGGSADTRRSMAGGGSGSVPARRSGLVPAGLRRTDQEARTSRDTSSWTSSPSEMWEAALSCRGALTASRRGRRTG